MNTIEQEYINHVIRVCKLKREDYLSVNTASCTCVSYMQLDMLNKLFQEDCPEEFKNAMKEMIGRLNVELDKREVIR